MEVCLSIYDKIFVKQKIAKLKFLKWTSKIERIVDLKIANEHNFITFTYFLMDFNLLWYKIT